MIYKGIDTCNYHTLLCQTFLERANTLLHSSMVQNKSHNYQATKNLQNNKHIVCESRYNFIHNIYSAI